MSTKRHVSGPAVIEPMEEIPRISTNASSQWGLATIQNLALIGDVLEEARASLPTAAKRGQDLGKDTF